MADDNYVCSLSEESLKKAKKELHEDPRERLGAVKALREWILQQPHMKCQTETLFLLRFLRAAKFSQLRARELIENYLTTITSHPEWCNNIDMQHEGIQEVLKMKYVIMLPPDDKHNIVSLNIMGNLDVKSFREGRFTTNDMMRTIIGSSFGSFYDEESMVHGAFNFCDVGGFSMKHSEILPMDVGKKSVKLFKNAFPGRIRGLHYYNVSPVFETLMMVCKPIMPKKWIDRVKLHSTMESVYKHFPQHCLPLEYLPDDYHGTHAGTVQQAADKFNESVASEKLREHILYMTNPENFWIDLKCKPDVPHESFRKLNIE